MKKIYWCAVLLALINCIPYTKVPALSDVPLAPVKTEWEKYGAYYEYNELFIETTYVWNPFMSGPQTKYVINKRLRILTTDGAKYASVNVQYYAPISVFKLAMKDSLGQQVTLNTAKIRSEYDKTGILLFPKVTAGCQLDINIVFSELQSLSYVEYGFYEEIPVLQGKFTFSYLRNKYQYEIKTYGAASERRENENPDAVMGKFTQCSWLQQNLLPPSRISYMKSIYETEPRVSVVFRKFYTGDLFQSEQEIYTTWEKLAESYSNNLLKTSFFQSSSKLRKKAHELTDGLKSDFDKADAVLKWIQENISYKWSYARAINPDKVFEKREGNMGEQTFLLREMFREINVFKDIIVTRARNRGGFDPDFVTPVSLSIPLLIAEIGGKSYIAYPFYRGAKLGEYPSTFFGVKGLSVERKEIAALPEPFSRQWNGTFSYELGLGQDSTAQKLKVTFVDYWAYDVRTDLVAVDKENTKEIFQKMLTNLGLSNALKSCIVQHLDDRGSPLTVEIEFESQGQMIKRKDQKIMKLDHLFGSYFSFYDSSRTSSLTVDLNQVIMEEITIPKKSGISFETHIKCDPISNPLFSVSCQTRETDAEYYFSRTITIKKTEISAEEMRRLYPDIARLKQIEESYLVIR